MTSIATLTLNPTIDVAYEVERVFHTRKMRTLSEDYSPGGGGINVARVFVRLGGHARCYYLSGGGTGTALDGLMDLHQMVRTRIPIQGVTRVSTSAADVINGKEYRFVPPGPFVQDAEWQTCLERLDEVRGAFLVASGSLPPGVPPDFYARAAGRLVEQGIRLVLDSSGAGLSEGLAGSNIYLVKPSLGELRQLVGAELQGIDAVCSAAMEIVATGRAQLVAVTMGHAGAILARKEGPLYLPAPAVEVRSAVGAGDSFLAAMVFALSIGWQDVEAFRYGMAAGAAAVLTPGTGLSQPEDIRRLFALIAKA